MPKMILRGFVVLHSDHHTLKLRIHQMPADILELTLATLSRGNWREAKRGWRVPWPTPVMSWVTRYKTPIFQRPSQHHPTATAKGSTDFCFPDSFHPSIEAQSNIPSIMATLHCTFAIPACSCRPRDPSMLGTKSSPHLRLPARQAVGHRPRHRVHARHLARGAHAALRRHLHARQERRHVRAPVIAPCWKTLLTATPRSKEEFLKSKEAASAATAWGSSLVGAGLQTYGVGALINATGTLSHKGAAYLGALIFAATSAPGVRTSPQVLTAMHG